MDLSGDASDDPKVQDLFMEGIDEAYFQQKQKICNWLIKKEQAHKSNRKRAASVLSSASGSSGRSKRSKASSDASHSSRMSTNQRAKIASLKAEADMLQRTKEAELKAQMLTIQGKIAKAEAKAQVYEEEEKRFASLTEAVRKDQIEIHDKAANIQVTSDEAERAAFLTKIAKSDKIELPSENVDIKTPSTETPREVTTSELNTMRSLPTTWEVAPTAGASADIGLRETMTKMLKVHSKTFVLLINMNKILGLVVTLSLSMIVFSLWAIVSTVQSANSFLWIRVRFFPCAD